MRHQDIAGGGTKASHRVQTPLEQVLPFPALLNSYALTLTPGSVRGLIGRSHHEESLTSVPSFPER